MMEILAAYDLMGSYRDAAALVGCSHHTVARQIRARDAGGLRTTPAQRDQLIDPFREKIEEWVDASHRRVRADVAQRKLQAMGYAGSGARRGARSPRPRPPIELATGGGFGRGCRSQGCGSNGITPTVHWSLGTRAGCGAPGWRGAAFAWCCRCAMYSVCVISRLRQKDPHLLVDQPLPLGPMTIYAMTTSGLIFLMSSQCSLPATRS